MMTPRTGHRILPLLLLLPIASVSSSTRAQEVITQETGGANAGGSAVIEIGGSGSTGDDTGTAESGSTAEPEQPVNITRHPGNTGIEMIIGGQSEDGVAKRGHLPVVE